MSEDQEMQEINYEEQYRQLSEENKKLSIDIASLQLSNRSLVNQNRDEKKKVMDCRLQISDLENRLKAMDNLKRELSESQTQAERLRQSLDANENKLQATEKRAIEAEGLVKVKDSIIDKQRKFSKELEDKVQKLIEEVEGFKTKCSNLEVNLRDATDRAEECDRLREALKAKSDLLDKLSESSGGVSEAGLAAANEYFKAEEAKLNEALAEMKQAKKSLSDSLEEMTSERDALKEQISKQEEDIAQLREKCSNLEASLKDSKHSDKRSKSDNARLIGPSLPPWIMEEKKPDPSEIEKLNNADPATLRARVLDLEGKVHELNQLLTYREDVILRIYQEIQKKANKLEASEVERSSLSAQVSILKRELAALREEGGSRGGRRYDGAYPPEIEIEIERLRGKRDREYQRRKRAEAEMDEMEVELNSVKEKVKKLEEELAELANAPKQVIHAGDPADKTRIAELQTVVNQLRLDNESKRSELFDLRSRFDEKSSQLESFSSEMKAKERQVKELTTELTSKTTALEQTTKELEVVRLRAVRGGVETERWQTDLNSVRLTNRLLAQQTNDLRSRLASTEEELTATQKRLIAALKAKEESQATTNGTLETDKMSDLRSKISESESQLSQSKENVADLELAKKELSDLKAKYAALEKQLKQLNNHADSSPDATDSELLEHLREDLKREHASSSACEERCAQLTKRLNELESTLVETRRKLTEATSENRRAELGHHHHQATEAGSSSPPAKRARRTRASSSTTSQECSTCTELKRQVEALEADLNDANARINSSVSELNEVRSKLTESSVEACKLRGEVSKLHERLAVTAVKVKKIRNAAQAYLDDSASPSAAAGLRELLVD